MEFHPPKRGIVENAKRIKKICPRCNNFADFVLYYSKTGIGLGKMLLITTKTTYELHCSICLYSEIIPKSFAKTLLC